MTKIIVNKKEFDIDLNNYYTDVQDEHIYFSNSNDIVDTKENINNFFNELILRQRGSDKDETAVQAVMTASSNSFAAKIAENDGLDPHNITVNNLIRFLCGGKNFFKTYADLNYVTFNALLSDSEKQMLYNNLKVRIIVSEHTLKVYCTLDDEIVLSRYQLDIIQCIADACNKLSKKYPSIDIQMGVFARKNNIVFEGTFYLDSTYEALTYYINEAKENKEINNKVI